MHTTFALCALAILSTGCAASGSQDPQSLERTHVHNVNMHFGQRSLDDETAWEPGEEQATFGVEFDTSWKQSRFVGFGFEASMFASYDSEDVDAGGGGGSFDFDTSTFELAGGARLTLEAGDSGLRFFAGAGVAVIGAGAEGEAGGVSVSDHDESGAFYGHVGGYWCIAERFNVGLDYRVLIESEVDVFGVDTDADYEQVTLLVGFSL